MNNGNHIDVTFDFRSDTPRGTDPDARSPTLRRYHKLLWSKPLPSGVSFELNGTTRGVYLHHRSRIGEFYLSSDAVIPTFTRARNIAHTIDQIPMENRNAFNALGYTIGGMMVFPGNKVAGRMTINGARGCHPRIKDRFDLTVECIRRHYSNESSPLSETLARYADYFGLFRDFGGYVQFFLLQDLVTDDFFAVKFFLPFDDFTRSPLPASVAEYEHYAQFATSFIEARNRRILQYCQT